jgi:hypothetical protein
MTEPKVNYNTDEKYAAITETKQLKKLQTE